MKISDAPLSGDTAARDTRAPAASSALMAAALSGLLGVAMTAGCGSEAVNADQGLRPTAADAGADGADGGYNNVIATDTYYSLEDFQALCDARGGYVYVNSTCNGGAACKGLSWHGGTLWEHSCRGQNSSCSGIGCVDMPKDTGLSGQDIYKDGPCGSCHGGYDEATMVIDYGKFAIYFYPGDISEKDAMARYKNSTEKRLTSIVAWGVSGFHEDEGHTPYNNMPFYYQKYSSAEITRVVDYLKTLEPFTHATGIFGVDGGSGPHMPDGGPSDGGVQNPR